MRMRRNHRLKKQLETDVQHVQLNLEECEEFLYTLLQMFEARPNTYQHHHIQPPIQAPTPVPRSRRTSFMSVDQVGSLENIMSVDQYEKVLDTDKVIDTDKMLKVVDTDKDKMPPPPPPPPPPLHDPLPPPVPDYLDDIKKGVVLKPVSRTRAPRSAPAADPLTFALRNKLNERREATEVSDVSEPNSEWSN